MSCAVEMIFEIGFNYCCRNLFSGGSSVSSENLNIKFSANLLNEVTKLTENCSLEFFGDWARVLSFIEPNMDMQILGSLPSSLAGDIWNDCVVVKNFSCPEPIETRYLITKVVVVETKSEGANRYIEFDKARKILECKLIDSHYQNNAPQFPNYWMDHKRKFVDKVPGSLRPLTTITSDVPVINLVSAFVANSAPGPYKFSHPTAPYVRTHVHVCDYSYRNLRLAAIRTGGEESKDVPCFHLHLQIDQDVPTTALPWLCVGDVLEVSTVKPVFAHKQTWNLYHKQKNFGETKILVFSILDGAVSDIQGRPISPSPIPSVHVNTLREWMRERLLKDSLVGSALQGTLSGRDLWFSGRDLVARIDKINRYTNSIFVTDFTICKEDSVEVRIRSSQQNFVDALNYLFTKLEKNEESCNIQYVLLRNLRINSNDNSLYCSVEHVTRVPEFCFDVQQLIKRQHEADQSQVPTTSSESGKSSFSFDQMIPSQWKENLKIQKSYCTEDLTATQTACVEANSQIQFEFVDDTDENENLSPYPNSDDQIERSKGPEHKKSRIY